MDDARIRTFLEIANGGSFQSAAEVLNVTQTTVSARIRTLEQELGRRLFHRDRRGASLTPAGEAFLRYARTLIEVWERARHNVAVPPGRSRVLAVGSELNLWNPLLVDWMVGMRESAPDVALRVQVGLSDQLVDAVRTGVLDLAVLYAPKLQPGVRVEVLTEETLVLVATPDASDADYVHVDWGPQFAEQESALLPARPDSTIHVGHGPLGLTYLLRAGGSGYFRRGAVDPYVRDGRLALVDDAPEVHYPIFAVYSAQAEAQDLDPALTVLRNCIGASLRPIV